MSRSPGRRPTGETYSVAQVAVLLLLTPQIWIRSISGDLQSTRAEVACPRCFGKREIRFRRAGLPGVVFVDRCPMCGGRTTSSEEIADALADLARGYSDPTQIATALADLGTAWGRIGDGARSSIREFLRLGPMHVGHGEIEFQRERHRSAVLRLWRAINEFGEYATDVPVWIPPMRHPSARGLAEIIYRERETLQAARDQYLRRLGEEGHHAGSAA